MLDSTTHLFSLRRYSWSLKITQTFFLLRTAFLVYRWLNFKVLLLCTDDALLAQNLFLCYYKHYRLGASNIIY